MSSPLNLRSSLDIEELRGLESRQLMQDQQSVEKLGVQLQKLGRKEMTQTSRGERASH